MLFLYSLNIPLVIVAKEFNFLLDQYTGHVSKMSLAYLYVVVHTSDIAFGDELIG